MKRLPEISVVVLCYRGGEHIVPYVREVKRVLAEARLQFEIVLVANYDSADDPTPAIVRNLATKARSFVAVTERKAGKMGWDLRRGLAAARGKYLAFVDGDGQTVAADILRLYRLIREKDCDICKVYRESRQDSLVRKCVSLLYNALFRLLFPSVRVKDINAKPKLLKREAYERMQLTRNDWFIDAEIMLEAHRLRLKFSEIPGDALANSWRKSFIGPAAVFEFLKNLVVFRLRY